MSSNTTLVNPLDGSLSGRSAKDRAGRSAGNSRRIAGVLAAACLLAGLSACENAGQVTLDYLNLQNSLMDPSQVGLFDKHNAFGQGTVRPVKWPILTQLDVIDQNTDPFAAATDPTAADLLPDKREYLVNGGDVVRVSIYGLLQPDVEFTRDIVVNSTGTINIPYLGNVNVAGLTPTEIQDKLAQVAIDNKVLPPAGNGNPGPQISISLLQSQNRIFSAIGTVQRPGSYSIYLPDMKLLTALSQVGDVVVQPGLDYIYIIRSGPEAGAGAAAAGGTAAPGGNNSGSGVAPPRNPLEAIEGIEKGGTGSTKPGSGPATAPETMPGTGPGSGGPGSTGPALVRPLPSAVVVSGASGGGLLAQADLDAAISGGTVPGAAASTAPTPKPPTTAPADDLLNQAIGAPTATRPGQYVFVDGKWVLLPGGAANSTSQPAGAPPIAGTTPGAGPTVPGAAATAQPGDVFAATENITTQRVIRIPLEPLRAGDPRYNIIIRPGDVIMVPQVETGEFYMMGHVNRPGVFSLTGRKITLMMAVAAAGNLDSLAVPRRCDLIRRIGTNQQAIVQVNLQAIFNGEQPDIYLKPNDVVNVGTDAVAPFLAVLRNAYRLSYGFGFVYDRNWAPQAPVGG